MAFDKTDKSFPELLSDLSRETVDLVRHEVALVRAEMSEKVTSAERGIASIAIGAAVALAGMFVLLQAVVIGVAMLLPPEIGPWLSPLIVGLAIALIGYGMIKSGRSKLQPGNLMPNRTLNSLRRDRAVVQEHA